MLISSTNAPYCHVNMCGEKRVRLGDEIFRDRILIG